MKHMNFVQNLTLTYSRLAELDTPVLLNLN